LGGGSGPACFGYLSCRSPRTPRIPGGSWLPCATRWHRAATSCRATARKSAACG